MPHRVVWRTITHLVWMLLRKIRRLIIYRVLHVDDTPHRIALSLAVAIFVAWTPTIGLQMILTVAISALLGANKFVGVPFVWISNPFTMVPIYLPNYLLGSWLLGRRYTTAEFFEAVRDASAYQGGWWDRVATWWPAIWPVFPPLLLGSLIVAAVLGTLTYFLSKWGIVVYRRKRDEVMEIIHERRAKKRAGRLASRGQKKADL
ncbi:MAG: DUF2062 domain-containing protein [Phycisphaerae bacterium]